MLYLWTHSLTKLRTPTLPNSKLQRPLAHVWIGCSHERKACTTSSRRASSAHLPSCSRMGSDGLGAARGHAMHMTLDVSILCWIPFPTYGHSKVTRSLFGRSFMGFTGFGRSLSSFLGTQTDITWMLEGVCLSSLSFDLKMEFYFWSQADLCL